MTWFPGVVRLERPRQSVTGGDENIDDGGFGFDDDRGDDDVILSGNLAAGPRAWIPVTGAAVVARWLPGVV